MDTRQNSMAHEAVVGELLARANRGFLYIDEVNLLEDHLVDLLIDVAASGENVVEREGLSVRHPARFVLVGSGNPEEGELRPQLLDRFGLSVEPHSQPIQHKLDQALALRVATPQMVLNYAAYLEERQHFEDSFRAFERAIPLFPWPHLRPLWLRRPRLPLPPSPPLPTSLPPQRPPPSRRVSSSRSRWRCSAARSDSSVQPSRKRR